MYKKAGGRRYEDDPNVKISKKLSFILRHGAEKEGIKMGSDGFVLVNDLLVRHDFKTISFEKIQEIVEKNDKKRFELQKKVEGGKELWYIRASQGHTISSIKDEELLTKISQDIAQSFGVVVHGTYKAFWLPISKEGLKTMARNHMHFAIGYPGDEDVISGMRKTCDVFIEIDIVKAIQDGIDFFVSNNNVVLSAGIANVLPPKYFKLVKDKAGNILFRQPVEIIEQAEEMKQNN